MKNVLNLAPRHEDVVQFTELISRTRFFENVCELILGGNMFNGNDFMDDVGVEVMRMYGQMFGARAFFVIGSHFQADYVVFKCPTAHNWRCTMDREAFFV